jgi:hypothetical protein
MPFGAPFSSGAAEILDVFDGSLRDHYVRD